MESLLPLEKRINIFYLDDIHNSMINYRKVFAYKSFREKIHYFAPIFASQVRKNKKYITRTDVIILVNSYFFTMIRKFLSQLETEINFSCDLFATPIYFLLRTQFRILIEEFVNSDNYRETYPSHYYDYSLKK